MQTIPIKCKRNNGSTDSHSLEGLVLNRGLKTKSVLSLQTFYVCTHNAAKQKVILKSVRNVSVPLVRLENELHHREQH